MKRLCFLLFLLVFSVFFYLAIPVANIQAYYTNMPASVVIGQPDFVSGLANQGGSVGSNTLNTPGYFANVLNGKLIIPDQLNNRILIWNSIPTRNNSSANIVIGQPDFVSSSANQGGGTTAAANTMNTPVGVFSDGNKLFVADNTNNRILIYNSTPTTNNASADVVIGQSNFSASTANQGGTRAANTLNRPEEIIEVGNKLIISDFSNNRVLIWNSIPTTNNASADVVIGQTDFSGGSINQGGNAGANTLNRPSGLASDGTRLFIVDTQNNRVLIYNSIPTTNNASADVVIGQPNFTSNSANQGGSASANTFNVPASIFLDNKNRIYISDYVNNRLMIYNSIPSNNNIPADIVLGQPDFITTSSGTTTNKMNPPFGVAIDSSTGKLIVSDRTNHRILIFPNTIDTPQLSITTPLETVNNTTLRVKGSVQLGDRPNYSMQWVKSEINGNGLGNVTSLGGGRDNGTNQTLYDFENVFNPTVNGGTTTNYTMKLVASSFNADTTSLFYFQPFTFEYIRRTNPTLPITKQSLNISFLVNKLNIQRMKDNVDHFEVLTSTDSGKLWRPLTTNISTDKISEQGQIYFTISNTLLPGTKYQIKVVSISKDSNWRQDSNILTYFVPQKKVGISR